MKIPQKSQFKLNEVSSITSVKTYVLRFWETEFPQISPIDSSSGEKLYSHKDVEFIFKIKKLLFDEKLSIEEVKEIVSKEIDETSSSQDLDDISLEESTDNLLQVKNKLNDIIELTETIKKDHSW